MHSTSTFSLLFFLYWNAFLLPQTTRGIIYFWMCVCADFVWGNQSTTTPKTTTTNPTDKKLTTILCLRLWNATRRKKINKNYYGCVGSLLTNGIFGSGRFHCGMCVIYRKLLFLVTESIFYSLLFYLPLLISSKNRWFVFPLSILLYLGCALLCKRHWSIVLTSFTVPSVTCTTIFN